MIEELKSCPFCGAIPIVYWEEWKEISKTAGAFVLKASHEQDCFIRRMNGMNFQGRMTAFSKKILIDAWNRRVENDG